MPKTSKTLIVSHLIFLTKEERYKLAEGVAVETVGVSIPVWIINQGKKALTSEPAIEVFCRYYLTNEIDGGLLSKDREGFKVNMPQLPRGYRPPKELANDEWRVMSVVDQINWHDKNKIPATAKSLLDYNDGGSGSLRFYQVNKQGRSTKEMHFIDIKSIEVLKNTLEI